MLSIALFSRAQTIRPISSGTRKDYTLKLTNKDISPDGFVKNSIVVNGQTPGPLIKAKKGDTLLVNVQNDLTNSSLALPTSVHWHGIHMYNRNWADGVPSVTQCPIVPGNSFLYEVPIGNQAGTFWYHSHYSLQYCDGLFGPLVVYDDNDPHKSLYDIDDESTIITLGEWYHESAQRYTHDVWHLNIPRANSTLINGLGIAHNTNGTHGQHAVVTVKKGKRYRFRLINMACLPHFTFSIDRHNLTIIEADSIETKPMVVDSLDIYAGQRYSFVLTANQPEENYWIRALPFKAVSVNYENDVNTAILRYSGAANRKPLVSASVSIPASTRKLNEGLLEPLVNVPVPGVAELGHADINMTLVTTFDSTGFHFGNVGFSEVPVPVLLQILSGAREAQELLPLGALATLPPNKTVEITLPGASYAQSGPHPYHLHGHDFWVVKSADSTEPKFNNVIMRDTVNAGYENQSVTIRFRTDNPGPWMLHCHIDMHVERGLGIVFAEDTNGTAQAASESLAEPSNQWDNLCSQYNSWMGGH